MVLQEVLARLKGDGDQVLKKALRCSSAEELLELAGEHGIEQRSEAAEAIPFALSGWGTDRGIGRRDRRLWSDDEVSGMRFGISNLVGEGHGLNFGAATTATQHSYDE